MSKKFSKPFYNSGAWRHTRDAYVKNRINTDGGLCEICRENAGEELHHKTALSPANISDFDVSLNQSNLIFLCKDCHFKEHRKLILGQMQKAKSNKRITNNGMYFNDDGDLVKMEKHIVYGSPASGKTAYVKRNMYDGDLVVDLDLIKQAISLRGKTDAPDNLLPIAIAIRECIYDLIADGSADCKSAWIIASLPKRKERDELAKRLDADLIFMDTDYHECIRRAGLDAERRDKDMQRALIDRWFENFEK